MSKQNLMGISRTVDTLINNLCIHEISDKIFHMPTKAILGQGFSIAKINFFLMLHYLTGEIPDLIKNTESIFKIVENNVFTIMAEDVFISIISDKNIPLEIRANAGYRLANIWEFRIYKGINEFVPILNNIWHAREKLKPAYGTMIGISELFRLTQNSDSIWLDFLQKDDISQDEVESLQEFLMELSYEEMNLISEYMVKKDLVSISKEEVYSIIGKRNISPAYLPNDPRELYKSYKSRKNNALYRKRSSLNGPKKTIEEYIMSYLLSKQEKERLDNNFK